MFPRTNLSILTAPPESSFWYSRYFLGSSSTPLPQASHAGIPPHWGKSPFPHIPRGSGPRRPLLRPLPALGHPFRPASLRPLPSFPPPSVSTPLPSPTIPDLPTPGAPPLVRPHLCPALPAPLPLSSLPSPARRSPPLRSPFFSPSRAPRPAPAPWLPAPSYPCPHPRLGPRFPRPPAPPARGLTCNGGRRARGRAANGRQPNLPPPSPPLPRALPAHFRPCAASTSGAERARTWVRGGERPAPIRW